MYTLGTGLAIQLHHYIPLQSDQVLSGFHDATQLEQRLVFAVRKIEVQVHSTGYDEYCFGLFSDMEENRGKITMSTTFYRYFLCLIMW